MKSPQKKSSMIFKIFGFGLVVGGVLLALRTEYFPFSFSVPLPASSPTEQGGSIRSTPSSILQPQVKSSFRPNSQSNLKASNQVSGASVKAKEKKNFDEDWREFTARFGSSLEPQFNSYGQLISIRGAPGAGTTASSSDFKTQDSQKVIQRGMEIINAASELLGLRSDLPLSSPISRSGPISAQLYFRETYHGLNLLPEGNLKIDLGPRGEVLGLSSDYISNLNVISNVKLTSQDAFDKALSSVGQGKASSVPITEGNKIVWVAGATPASVEGHVAYQFFIHGREIVIDAGTGDVLLSRNRRQE